jgi:tetratricopeptide (TPR) repeat protein
VRPHFSLLLFLTATSCIGLIDVTRLSETIKKNEKEKATGRPVALEAYEPAELETRPRTKGPPIVFHVRAYADEEYRAANMRWQERIKLLVTSASEYLEDAVGARLEVESVQRWEHRSAKDSTEHLLRELQARDAGKDVDFVVGFVSPLGFVTTVIHEIGMANAPGRHFVLRGIDDTQEAAALAKYFKDVDATQRADFLARRRHHKELVVFVHEWLHNLGAIHHADREALMHPSYAHQQRTLDGENAEVVALSLQAVVAARTSGAAPDYGKMRAYVARTRSASWYTGDREQLLAVLPAPVPGATPAAPELASSTPNFAGLEGLRGAVEEARWEAAIAGCLSAPARSSGPQWSAQLAELCARAGMVALAEHRLKDAAGKEGDARKAIDKARHQFGLAPRAALTPDQEAARARAWFTARAALDAKHPEDARAALKPVLHAPDDAGLLALSCEAAVNYGTTGKDDGSCERAIAAWDEMPAALFWSALARANAGDRDVAVTRLVRAKTLDPAFEGSWKVLADLYRLDGKRAELKALRAEYQTHFGQPLR